MIPEFYEDCEIFLTGGSGVVGKALIDKLLRSCNVRRIYVLLRAKKDLSIAQRLDKITNLKIFRQLRSVKPDALKKLVAIPGDVILPNLGITPEYAQILANVSIVFHCAATIRFDEPMKVAIKVNVSGTLEALKFAQTLKDLKLFMHVSTFFSNPYLTYVEPKVYPSPMDWKFCLKLLNEADDDTLDILTKKLITGFPNTYTFTKNLAESMVNDFRDRLPVAIYRPSIVIFALSEPEHGYPPSLSGAMGLFVLAGAGILKMVPIDKQTSLDMTPQDLGIKSMLYYAQKAGNEYRERKFLTETPVFMFSSRKFVKETFQEIGELMYNTKIWEKSCFEKSLLLPGCHYTSSSFYYMLSVFYQQIIPAILGDCLLTAFGRKPLLMSIVRKTFISIDVMKPFLFNNFDSECITDYERMAEVTRGTEFEVEIDLEQTGTRDGILTICHQMLEKVREVLLDENAESLKRARKLLLGKKIVYHVMRVIFAYYILRWLYRVVVDYVSSELDF